MDESPRICLGYLSIDAIFEPIWSRSGLRVLTFIVPPGLMYIIWLIPSGMYWWIAPSGVRTITSVIFSPLSFYGVYIYLPLGRILGILGFLLQRILLDSLRAFYRLLALGIDVVSLVILGL